MGPIDGLETVKQWFGCWPSFHDAEVLEVHLDRAGPCYIRILTWLSTGDVDEHGHYATTKHAVVTFLFEGVRELELDGFSSQNVIAGLELETGETGMAVTLYPCFGLSGRIEAAAVRLELAPR